MSESCVAIVNVAKQTMSLEKGGVVLRSYRISTAAAGVGSEEGSGKTPPGRHAVASLFGARAKAGQVFASRKPVKGFIIPPADWNSDDDKDYVLTRIIRLRGLEPGINKGAGIDSYSRYIYIHGTNHEHLIGTPSSHGCIRLSNEDVIEFFDFVKKHRDIVIDIVGAPAHSRKG